MRTLALALAALVASPSGHDDTCLLLVARNLSKDGANFHLYHQISAQAVEVRKGDRLRYEIFLPPSEVPPKGGIDVLFTNDTNVRDTGALDSAGLPAHGDTLLNAAVGKWLAREIDLSAHAGKTTKTFVVQFEGDETGDHVQLLDAVEILRADGTKVVIYADGPAPSPKVSWRNGYSERVLCVPVPRASVKAGPELDRLLADKRAKEDLFHARAELAQEVTLVERFAKAEKADDVAAEARRALDVPSPDEFQGTSEEYLERLHQARHHLQHAHPLMRRYSGHLVGHAHIDLQWLWEWPEGLDFTRSTFEQACKFMDEFPEFTFSQSSAGLYEKIEEQYPELFARIVARAKEGRWEIVGGRWCEGDTNLISAESHARHLLHGQRYFQSRFGRACTVGWEPDTFGHTRQLPQILKLGGIDSYYFCRAGQGKPLFWWQGPDGSRVLAFDEPASGSWYNSDVGDSQVEELLAFYEKTGLKDLMWVYGVGNHGGGPTREQIEKALSWRDKAGRPEVKFGTAQKFFELCRAKDLTGLPVVDAELNPVFMGCYTTHGDVKRLNRDAEAALETAETVAWMASQSGYPYPAADLARAWKDVLWNHHHDTLPGSGIHESYELTHLQLGHAVETARWIARSAVRHLAHRVADEGKGLGLLVVNPLGWTRSATVRAAFQVPEGRVPVVYDAAGSVVPSQLAGPPTDSTLTFVASDLPPFGWSSFRVSHEAPNAAPAPAREAASVETAENGWILKSSRLRVTVDRKSGEVTSVLDGASAPPWREVLTQGRPGNRIEAHLEKPHGMSAWSIGPIAEVAPVNEAVAVAVLASGPAEARVAVERKFRGSTIRQQIVLAAGSARVDFETEIDWKERGAADGAAPMLRVAFPLGEPAEPRGADGAKAEEPPPFEARYAVPFGDVTRKADGVEGAALTWGWILGAEGGAALLNDAKHGYSATADGVLRLTLVRASVEPDPAPDQYVQRVTFSLAPLGPGAPPAAATRLGFDLNRPAIAQRVLHNTINVFAGDRKGIVLPASAALVRLDGSDALVATALKRAEDGDDAILRFYNAGAAAARDARLTASFATRAEPVDFLERPLAEAGFTLEADRSAPGAGFRLAVGPYRIATVRLRK